MTRPLLLSCALVLAACAPRDEGGESMEMDTTAAPASMTLADLAGTWTVETMGETSDSVLTTFQLSGTADPGSWTMTFPGGETVPMQVQASGDSIVMESGSFPSQLRPGVTVRSTRSVLRLESGMLMGTVVATYEVTTADSVFRGRIHGTRVQ